MYKQQAEGYYRSSRETSRVNTHGDVYSKNDLGQITTFSYADSDILFTFGYDKSGALTDINSSTGWSWTKTSTNGFEGWLVRNYFERWFVSEEECDAIHVTEFGVKATGKHADKMELPERP